MEVFVDWGSTNFRAFLMRDGQVIDRRAAGGGGTLKGFVSATAETRANDYSRFFVDQLGDWLKEYPQAPVYICGAVGGREGWVETQYSVAPAGFAELRRNLHKLTAGQLGHAAGRDIYIATGCTIAHPDGRHDVIRSEEVKSLGAARHLKLSEALLCIPGTHCKWVQIANDRIICFETALAGEVFAILSEHGALAAVIRGEPVTQQPDFASFDGGLELAGKGLDLLTDLWQVRAQKLRSDKPPASLRAYLSGILLGHELRQMEKFFPGKPPAVLLADAGSRQEYYRRAFAHFNWRIGAEVDSETAVHAGLSALRAEAAQENAAAS
jgi:2-dehydro-3-deoxygalactonokinase